MSEHILAGPTTGKVAWLTDELGAEVVAPGAMVWPPAAGELYLCVQTIDREVSPATETEPAVRASEDIATILLTEQQFAQAWYVATEVPGRTFLRVSEAAAVAAEPDLANRLQAARA